VEMSTTQLAGPSIDFDSPLDMVISIELHGQS